MSDRGIGRRRPPADRRGGRARAARGRQRRRRRGRRDAGLVGRRAAADRPGRGRLHARRRRAASEPTLLDFFVAAPGRRRPARARRCWPSSVSLRRRDAGLPRRRGVVRRPTAMPAGLGGGARALGHASPLADLAAPAAALARDGVAAQRRSRPTSSRSSTAILRSTPEARARCSRPTGRVLREGDVVPLAASSATRSSASAPTAPRRSTPATSPPAVVDWVGAARRRC